MEEKEKEKNILIHNIIELSKECTDIELLRLIQSLLNSAES